MLNYKPIELTKNDSYCFWSRVDVKDPSQCWVWRAGREVSGYGQFDGENGITYKAHRVAYLLHNDCANPLALTHSLIRHNCDNPPCCNPYHLAPGTDIDNSRDAQERGRLRPNPSHIYAKGSKASKAKLTEEQVIEIRRLHDECHISQKRLGEMYGVTGCAIHNVVRRKFWKHI